MMVKNMNNRATLLIEMDGETIRLASGEETPVSTGSYIGHTHTNDKLRIVYRMKHMLTCETQESQSETEDGEPGVGGGESQLSQ
jgi:hypothetical protein